MHSLRLGISATVLALVAMSHGCGGSSGNAVADAGGTVTLNGKPVPNVVVTLTPVANGEDGMSGKSASGITDQEGRFTLSTYEIGDGAIVGTHRVGISMDGPNPTPPGKLPSDYTVEVESGSNDISIELTN